MNEELKPCPFCGSEAEHQYSEIDHMNIYRCSSSKCITRRFDWYLRDDWNTRPIEDTLRKQLDEAKELIKKLIEDGWYMGEYGTISNVGQEAQDWLDKLEKGGE